MKRYDIVNKIVIEDGSVFLSRARGDVRPLAFQRDMDLPLSGGGEDLSESEL